MARHPIQPLETDDKGVLRFKRNAIVCYLLDNGGIDMNKIATLGFSLYNLHPDDLGASE